MEVEGGGVRRGCECGYGSEVEMVFVARGRVVARERNLYCTKLADIITISRDDTGTVP